MGAVLSTNTLEDSMYQEKDTSDEEDFTDAEENIIVAENIRKINTDAVDSILMNPVASGKMNPRLTLETVQDIEGELASYEQVALVFLLYEQEDIALQSLLVEKQNTVHNISSDFIAKLFKSKQKPKNLQNQLIEALCIVQNYAILKQLGYEKNEMINTYLPSNPYTSIYVNNLRKALYIFCESLTKEETDFFINHLKEDFVSKNFQFIDFGTDYLEAYLLQCFSTKYIKNNDFSNLISVVKRIDLSKADILESVVELQIKRASPPSNTENRLIDERRNFNLQNDKIASNSLNSSEIPDRSVIGDTSIVKRVASSDCYEIDPKNVGICMIINQEEFHMPADDSFMFGLPPEPLETRIGSSLDKEKLQITFKNLGFRIIVRENLKDSEILQSIDEVLTQFKREESCFVLCILSHGIEEHIYGSNSLPIHLTKIEDRIHSSCKLLSKPKIMLVQSCQGKVLQKVWRKASDARIRTDGPNNVPCLVPQKRDLLVCMSTVAGFVSFRSELKGSWFIQTLCDSLEENCDSQHFQDILTIVIGKVSNTFWNKDGTWKTMVPEYRTTLWKQLYLRRV